MYWSGLFSFNREKQSGVMILLVILFFSFSFYSIETMAASSIRIESVDSLQLNSSVDIAVYIDSLDSSYDINGFDILIDYDRSGLIIYDVEPGQLLNDCDWEYFNYRFGSYGDTLGTDSVISNQIVRIVGVAEINNNITSLCNISEPGELFILRFNTTSNPMFSCATGYISFFWADCGDNLFSLEGTTDVLVSDRVFAFGDGYTYYEANFPTWSGTPNSCFGLGESQLIRGVDFYGGSVNYDCNHEDTISDASVYISFPSHLQIGNEVGPVMVHYENNSSNPVPLGGFDLLMQFDPNVLSVSDVELSNSLKNCNWEYFTYRVYSDTNCIDTLNCIDGLLRIVGIADIGNFTVPSCYIDSSKNLANIKFMVADDSSLVHKQTSLNWIWTDCGDNTFSNIDGDSLFLSRSVFDAQGIDITSPSGPLPGFGGAPDLCFLNANYNTYRGINYYSAKSGYFEMPINSRGDLNLNMISYEIADHIIFTNYLLYGLSAFIFDEAAQIAASDINANGIPLELNDYLYNYRVIIGDAVPIVNPGLTSFDTVTVINNVDHGSITVEYDGNLSALYLKFDEVTSFYNLSSPNDDFAMYDTMGSAIIYAPFFNEPINVLGALQPGHLFDYNSSGELIDVQAAIDGTTHLFIDLVTKDSGATDCCVMRGNFDHDNIGQISISDLIDFIVYLFEVGPAPECMEEINVDGQGAVGDLADLIYLVNYMFLHGPPPPSCIN